MTRRTFTPDELRELAKDRGPFFADTARAALIYCADVKAAADEAIQDVSRRLAAAEARNATLTDDAARWRHVRDEPYTEEVARVMRYQLNASMDQAVDAARAAASISTKGDGP